MLKLCKINACSDGMLGLHLSRVPWDPYPWVSGIQDTSNAYMAGIRTGDTVLEVNGFDIIGQKISELAALIRGHWKSGASEIQFLIWRNKTEQNAINQQSLQKYATCLQNIAQLLECPICLEIVKPPGWQCCNGHVLCNSCRLRTTKCSICRVTLGPKGRCLLSDKLFTLLAESFPCNGNTQTKDSFAKDQKTIIPAQPNAAIRYIKRKSKQIVMIKVSSEVSEDEKQSGPALVAASTLNRSYHCPTGKSCVSPNSCELDRPRLLCSQWDVLTHLRRVHQLSVTQHYGTYGERIEVQLMNKSISCISLVPGGVPGKATTLLNVSTQPLLLKTSSELCDIENSPTMNQVLMSLDVERRSESDEERSVLSSRRTSTVSGDEVCANATDRTNDKKSEVEMFFVARISTVSGSMAVPQLEPVQDKDVRKSDGSATAGGNERCAIFIWYCGSEENVKKYQAVIECKPSTSSTATVTSKWNGFIHPLTRTWNSIRCQKEFLELEFDVANFFDIVIGVK